MKVDEIVGIKPLKPLSPAEAQVDSLKRQEKQLAATVKLMSVFKWFETDGLIS